MKFDSFLSLSFNSRSVCYFNAEAEKYVVNPLSSLKTLLLHSKFFICNKRSLAELNQSLQYSNTIDVLELVLFLFPRCICAPNPISIYNFLTNSNLEREDTADKILEQETILIYEIVKICLNHISSLTKEEKEDIASLASFLKDKNWFFSELVLFELKEEDLSNVSPLKAWERVKDFRNKEESTKKVIDNNLASVDISQEEVIEKLTYLTSSFVKKRAEQEKYALEISKIFISKTDESNFVFAEAGTGTGKTLGYIAPAVSFIEKNPTHQVLISTYSKALQKQILSELRKAFDSEEEFYSKVASIKGSNNYLCLLNYKNLLGNLRLLPNAALFVAIISRWIKNTQEGDLLGGELSPLIFELFPQSFFSFLLNRKEECIYNKCPHYKNCFVMSVKHKARNSNIIVSNHAFSLLNSGLSANYVIFDEAHHLFSTADEVFSFNISLISTYSLKVWITGSNSHLQSKKETNGFKTRLYSILKSQETQNEEEQKVDLSIASFVDAFIASSHILPDTNALDRIKEHSPRTVMEVFLYQVYLNVLQNNDDLNQYYTQECSPNPNGFTKELIDSIELCKQSLDKMLQIGLKLYSNLEYKLLYLPSEDKQALEELMRIFESFCLNNILEFLNMLEELYSKSDSFIYRFIIEKEEGSVFNVGYLKNYIDPSLPLAANILSHKKGVAFSSATLSDSYSEGVEFDQFDRFGLNYVINEYNVSTIRIKSPFDYKSNSKIIILNANMGSNINSLSNAVLEIFRASCGGALTIFTAITRLKQVYKIIQPQMLEYNIKLMAQHINNQKLSQLIDIFKDDVNSCLLGTDSTRDGIDVPGDSLRMVIFEKVPWPKPDILFKARVDFLGRNYVDQTIRLKLRQAYGRIIRKETDKGIFVLLQNMVPSEFLKAFPPEVEVLKVSLEDSLQEIKDFFKP